MSFIKFHHVFLMLLTLATLGAFVIPPAYTNAGRAQVQGLFSPVSRPTLIFASWVHQKFANDQPPDQRSPRTLADENEHLKVSLASLDAQLDQLKQLNRDRELLGDVRDLCIPLAVTGADPGGRESLSISGTTLQGVRQGMKVLYPGGLVGTVDRSGTTGAQVRLLTDRGFKLLGRFGRFITRPDGHIEFTRIATDPVLFIGQGNGTLVSTNFTTKDFQQTGIKNGDWLTLDDRDWPMNLTGYKIGRVVNASPQANSPLFTQVTVAPVRNLLELREVMVMVK